MKTTILAIAAMLAVVGCSPPNRAEVAKADAGSADAHAGSMNMGTMTPQPGDLAATRASKQAMARMMEGAPAYTGDPDVDFNRQMRVHHVAAIEMAEVELAHGKDAESRALAQKVIADQKREVAQIDAWLRKRVTRTGASAK